jgi:putative selenate reductase FAD-binding subunit
MAEKFVIAGTAEEAAALKTAEAAYLAGGTEINRLGSLVSPGTLISIRKIEELKTIGACDGKVVIGAGCTFQDVIECEIVPDYLKEACHYMGSRIKRNMATIGGNIAMKRDDSYLLPTLIAAGAVLMLMGSDGSTCDLTIDEYVSDRNGLYDNALILSVSIPESLGFIASNRQANTVESNARMTVSLSVNDGKYKAGLAMKKAGLYILDDLAEKLAENPEMSEEELIAWAKAKEMPLEDDKIFGGAEYRRYLLGVVIARILRDYGKGGQS